MQGPQVLHRHLQDLRFLQLPRALQQAGEKGIITSPLRLRCAAFCPAALQPPTPMHREGGRSALGRRVCDPLPTCLARAMGTVFPSSVRQRLMRSLLRFSITLWETGVLCKIDGAH